MTTLDTLDAFTRAYIDAAIWTDCNPDNEELCDKTEDDLAPETVKRMAEDCARFQSESALLLERASTFGGEHLDGYGSYQAGLDFWLTRNRHGVGFWDRGLDEIGEALTQAAHKFPETRLYLGDDGKIYCS